MGTLISLTAFDAAGAGALEEAKRRVLELHRKWNAFDPESEISRVNRMAGVGFTEVSEDTFRVIARSVHYAELSGGAFDITAGPAAMLWKQAIKAGRMPAEDEIKAAKELICFRDILLDAGRNAVMLRRRRQRIDLGAVAKGYAADEVKRLLREAGAENALLNLGGSVTVLGAPRAVGVQNPFAKTGEPFAFTSLENRSAVTSGVYEQQTVLNGRQIHHIVDPRTGRPSATELAGVTMIGDRAETLDALCTAALASYTGAAMKLAESCGAEAVLIARNGGVYLSKGLKNNFRFI